MMTVPLPSVPKVAIEFEAKEPVSLLVGYFRDDQTKYAKAPKLETDASANDYKQAEAKRLQQFG